MDTAQHAELVEPLDKIVFTGFLRFRFFAKGRLTADITPGPFAMKVLSAR
jgi:hypothetical protein